MKVVASTKVPAPIDDVWEIVSDPGRLLDVMHGITRWEVATPGPVRLGSRYRMLFRVGSAELGGLIEVTELSPPHDLAWTSVLGVDQRGRWRLRPAPRGGTRVELRLSYVVTGSGLWGWLAERLAAPVVQRHARRTLGQLRRIVQHEQMRMRAEEARAAAA